MNWLLDTTVAAVVGFILDLLIGDPVFALHPVRLIGRLIAFLEKKLRKPGDSCSGDIRRGTAVAVLTVTITALITFAVVFVCGRISRVLLVTVEALMCWVVLSARDMTVESRRVYSALADGDLPRARQALSMIVGRDTEKLSEEEIVKATVETVAENTSDGEIAPLFYLFFGGVVFGFIYKAVNTLDSMIAYRNDRYYYFGRAAAVADDVMNYIPSRIAARLMIVGAGALGFDRESARRVHRRDAMLHDSPNSAQTESACAGALNIRLAGFISYGGRLSYKPELGDPMRKAGREDINNANKMMLFASGLMMFLFVFIRLLIYLFIVLGMTGMRLRYLQ